MTSKSFQWDIVLFLFSFILFADLVLASPSVVKDKEIIESLEEIDDLNKNISLRKPSSPDKLSETQFTHRDEDMLADLKQSPIFASLKYDVEILESSEVKKEDTEIEERYKGPAINLNTDNFINENIEVQSHNINLENSVTNHVTLSIILIAMALVGFSLYVSLIVWRNHMQQRYSMRELLVTNDNEDYWPQDV